MYTNKVWKLVEAQNEVKHIWYKWLYKRKKGVDRRVEIFKIILKPNGILRKRDPIIKKPFYRLLCLNP